MDEHLKSGVYVIENTINGKRYIGSSNNVMQRKRAHLHSLRKGNHRNIHLQRAWNKYGKASFRFEILSCCSIKDLTICEQYWIDTLKPEYNIAPIAGNNSGIKHTDETKAKFSACRKGKKLSEEHIEKIRNALLGRKLSEGSKKKIGDKLRGIKHTEESRNNMRTAHLGKKLTEETRAKLSDVRKGHQGWFKGKKHSEEAKAKISASGTGRTVSEETRAKISASCKGIQRSEETRAKMSAAKIGKSPWNKGLEGYGKGRVCSQETRAKMSAARNTYFAKMKEPFDLTPKATPQQLGLWDHIWDWAT